MDQPLTLGLDVDDVDAAGLCAAVVENQSALRAAEARELALAAAWADLHGPDSVRQRRDGTGRVLPGTERVKQYGADGTPEVAEFAAADLAILLQVAPVTAALRIRDALDLRHRHPRCWKAVQAGRLRAWAAKKITMATASAGLTLEQARWVDAQIADRATRLCWGRLEPVLLSRIIAADPAEAERRRQAADREQGVWTGRDRDNGLRTLIARAPAPVVIAVLARVNQLAEILRLEGDTRPLGQRQAEALRLMATPHLAALLLEKYAVRGASVGPPADSSPGAQGNAAADVQPADEQPADDLLWERDLHPADNDADDPPDGPCPTCRGSGSLPARAGASPSCARPVVDPERLRSRAVLYVHVNRTAFTRGKEGVARVEGVGPITVEQARAFLRHHRVRVVPVLDPESTAAVDSYEVPATMREAVHLRSPASAHPWSASTSRAVDYDHTIAYHGVGQARAGSLGGRTRSGNLGKLTRHEHRIKTHALGWRVHQPLPGVFYWRNRYGYWARVDRDGTHHLGTDLPVPDRRLLETAGVTV